MSAYYNENDPKAAAWLRELIKQGAIANGEVDERSIEDVTPAELAGYTQCHFFAGIGGWSYALRLAGWPDGLAVWTGSCPCQPFSAAGARGGVADKRHLWPAWFHLISVVRPRVIFGEQVASKDGLDWLDIVQSHLEDAKYANAAFDLSVAGVGAPHVRQRIYFVADSGGERLEGIGLHLQPGSPRFDHAEAGRSGETGDVGVTTGCGRQRLWDQSAHVEPLPANADNGRMGDASGTGSGRDSGAVLGEEGRTQGGLRGFIDEPIASDDSRELAHADGGDAGTEGLQRGGQHGQQPQDGGVGSLEYASSDRWQQWRAESGRWSSVGGCEFLPCTDGKARPVEPGTFPLAHGVSGRVGLLRGYGNAIVPQVAAQVIGAYLESQAQREVKP